jgi:hypothetical protein
MKFKTSEVLSGATGTLFCQMEGVQRLMNFITGDNLFTHQLPRAFKFASPILMDQFPWIKATGYEQVGTENWQAFLSEVEAKYGAELDVHPALANSWLAMDPVQELSTMMGRNEV